MKTVNMFYLAKLGEKVTPLAGYTWQSGQWEETSNKKISSTPEIDVRGCSRIVSDTGYTDAANIVLYFFGEDMSVIGQKHVGINLDEDFPKGTSFIALEAEFSKDYSEPEFKFAKLFPVNPHYKNLSKQYKKKDGQLFFREELSGKVNLFGHDYLFVKNSSLEDKLALYIYSNNTRILLNEFNKTDCSFDNARKSVELKLSPRDQYTDLVNNYNKTFDLIKLAVAKEVVTLTKRCAIQIYIQGDETITNYAGGTYWEDEVSESIDSSEDLERKYFFAKGPVFKEISLEGFNYDINSFYTCIAGKSVWNGASSRTVDGKKYKIPCSIKFVKVASAEDETDEQTALEVFLMSDGVTAGYYYRKNAHEGTGEYYFSHDTYRIEIYSVADGTGLKLYQSDKLYGNDSDFLITSGYGLYPMTKVSQTLPNREPSPETFNLGENVIEHQIWGRILCDAESSEELPVMDLPYDDFAIERANFRKCIGLVFGQAPSDYIRFVQSEEAQDEATPWGLNDYGEYFQKPAIVGPLGSRLYTYPLAKSSWANTSLWVGMAEANIPGYGVEGYLQKYYREIPHKDCMEIGAVVKALLAKIDSSIKFESTAEYSEFFYGGIEDSYGEKGLKVYITQKSNVLKGEYDQAAQKAEITFEQLMNMLRDCFKCYWYVDTERRLRIEHIRYFTQGQSYGTPRLQFDLTKKYDKFNKKPVLYGQQEVSFSKEGLNSRYEFNWSDDSATDAMGGGFSVDIRSNYVQQDKKEDVSINSFTSDIDLMLLAPNKFSEDGFALIIAKDGKVPIVYDEFYNQQDTTVPMSLHIQNYYASFISLFNNYLYDMPALNIISSVDDESTEMSRYSVKGIKRCVEHKISAIPDTPLDLYALIGTDEGGGYIEELSEDIDTGLCNVILSYTPT